MLAALDALSKSPPPSEALQNLRSALRWLAAWSALYGFPGVADLARRADDEVTREVVLGFVPDGGVLSRFRSLATAIAEELAIASRSAVRVRCLLFSKAPGSFGPGGSKCRLLPRCEVVDSLDRLGAALADSSVLAVFMDLDAPLGEVGDAVELVRGCGGPLRPVPAIVGLGDRTGVVARYRLVKAGLDAILPGTINCTEAVRQVLRALESREVVRGTVFFLASDLDLRDKVSRDLAAADYKVVSCADLDGLLGRWMGAEPDLVMVAMTKNPGPALDALRELRADPHGRRLPMVAVLDRPDMEARQAALDAGANEWLLVPYAHLELVWRVCRAIEVRGLIGARADRGSMASVVMGLHGQPGLPFQSGAR